jgi:hypothetical protein
MVSVLSSVNLNAVESSNWVKLGRTYLINSVMSFCPKTGTRGAPMAHEAPTVFNAHLFDVSNFYFTGLSFGFTYYICSSLVV